ncbi:MAG: 6-oxocyclohex-1-ene-1-carbonyl-CoA hydratase, partial [Candidatus Eiseniibacteriota bacterium]
AVGEIIWNFTNLMPGCLIKSVDGIRLKKKFFWDQCKIANRHWLAVNMNTEAFLGFTAFNTRKLTGKDVIDFVKYRQLLAEAHPMDDELAEEVLGKPQK